MSVTPFNLWAAAVRLQLTPHFLFAQLHLDASGNTHTHTRTLISVITLDSAASGDANANTIDGPANTLTHARALAHTSEKKPPSIMSLPLKFVTVDYLSVSIIKAEMMNVFALF